MLTRRTLLQSAAVGMTALFLPPWARRARAAGTDPVLVSILMTSLRLRKEITRLPSGSRSSAFPWVQLTVAPDRLAESRSVIAR